MKNKIGNPLALIRILENTEILGHLASMKIEGRELPSDAERAVSLLEELIKDVKLVYEITIDGSSRSIEGR